MSDDAKVSVTTETAQQGADAKASQPAEGTTVKGADAGSTDELTRLREQALKDKIWREEKNKEIDDLHQRLRAQPAPQYQPPAEANPVLQRMQEGLMALQMRAQQGDAEAVVTLGILENQQIQNKRTSDELMISRLPAEDQETVRKLYDANRQRFGDPEIAHAWVERERLRKRASELSTKESELAKAEAEKRNGVVSVTTRPVAAPEAEKVRMGSLDEFNAEYDKLIAQGKTKEAWALSKRAATGELFRGS